MGIFCQNEHFSKALVVWGQNISLGSLGSHLKKMW